MVQKFKKWNQHEVTERSTNLTKHKHEINSNIVKVIILPSIFNIVCETCFEQPEITQPINPNYQLYLITCYNEHNEPKLELGPN